MSYESTCPPALVLNPTSTKPSDSTLSFFFFFSLYFGTLFLKKNCPFFFHLFILDSSSFPSCLEPIAFIFLALIIMVVMVNVTVAGVDLDLIFHKT